MFVLSIGQLLWQALPISCDSEDEKEVFVVQQNVDIEIEAPFLERDELVGCGDHKLNNCIQDAVKEIKFLIKIRAQIEHD